jgi:hypothetical protein
LLPEALLRCSVVGGCLVPRYLGAADHPWLRALVDEHDRLVGRPERELRERMREPLPCPSPPGKRALAAFVLGRMYRRRAASERRPALVRAAVFSAAARLPSREEALGEAARELSASPAEIEAALFADLPGERLVVAPAAPASPPDLALRCNLALVQGLLFRATKLEIELTGNARAVVRHARLRGLICAVRPRRERGEGAAVEVSGPLSVLRRTLLYGRALAELVPILSWCERFRLTAEVILRGESLRLDLATGDPLFPASEPRRYDSRLEERFARDFRRAAPGWDVLREPEPVEAGGRLIFPDFLLRERAPGTRSVLLEIAGFWTPAYLERKLADLRAARVPDLVLCIDEDRNVGEHELPEGTPVVRFRRRIDPAAVLAAIHDRIFSPRGTLDATA